MAEMDVYYKKNCSLLYWIDAFYASFASYTTVYFAFWCITHHFEGTRYDGRVVEICYKTGERLISVRFIIMNIPVSREGLSCSQSNIQSRNSNETESQKHACRINYHDPEKQHEQGGH